MSILKTKRLNMNLNALSYTDIKDQLTAREVVYKANDKKEVLVELLRKELVAIKPIKSKSKVKARYKPRGETITEQKLYEEAAEERVEVTITSKDMDEGKTGMGLVDIGSERGSHKGSFSFNKPVIMPKISVEALRTRTVGRVEDLGNGDNFHLDSTIESLPVRQRNASQTQGRYVINTLRD